MLGTSDGLEPSDALTSFTEICILFLAVPRLFLCVYVFAWLKSERVENTNVTNVWRLLSAEFFALVGISLLIAIPLAYLAMYKWLKDYEYRTEMSWWIVILVGAAAILITLLIVSFQTIKAAMANPIKSLRSE